jgi:hypothetical protein
MCDGFIEPRGEQRWWQEARSRWSARPPVTCRRSRSAPAAFQSLPNCIVRAGDIDINVIIVGQIMADYPGLRLIFDNSFDVPEIPRFYEKQRFYRILMIVVMPGESYYLRKSHV